jgi:5'-nucleotidase
MRILLTNDDGVHFEGLRVLYDRLLPRHHVTVVAPDRERSAIAHAITLSEPIRTLPVSLNGGGSGYAVTGTPADCVKLGLLEILDSPPDMVIAGINPGANVGVNLNYSGTVAAAKEAALYGIAAIAVSMDGRDTTHYREAADFVLRLAETVHARGLPAGTFLNVNLPNASLKHTAGVRISRQGLPANSEYFEKRLDPRERPYYWQGCETQKFEPHPEIDGSALGQQYISITPVKCDMTDYGALEMLKGWEIEI